MPETTVVHIALIAGAAAIGLAAGWILGARRSDKNKAAINKGWREQLAAKETQQTRLVEQNKSLMTQVSQFQASSNEAKKRTRELSESLEEALERRDRLQREIKDVRTNLEATVADRDRMRSEMSKSAAKSSMLKQSLAQRDAVIAKLNGELENWQNRVPPLIERFTERNSEVQRLESVLADMRQRILDLETEADARPVEGPDPTQTHIEPMRDPASLTDGRDASNEPMGERRTNGKGADDDAFETAFDTLRDDLKRIKGVGPAIEKTLNEMGIFRFNQIADMSEYDIDRVARRLKGFRTRIYREDWIGQARSLHDEKVGG